MSFDFIKEKMTDIKECYNQVNKLLAVLIIYCGLNFLSLSTLLPACHQPYAYDI